ncbi:MAG: FkbM family methyltransferase [Terracidiphilus sp.]
MADRPVWLSPPGIRFHVRGQLLTHGLTFALCGSQEPVAEALAQVFLREFHFQSFWDIGANIGHYTWLMKSAVPELEVVMIEPVPANAELIKKTLERNRLSNTTLIVAAASDTSGEDTLRLDAISGLTSTIEKGVKTFEENHYGATARELQVKLVSIDEIRAGHLPIDFMKIDVEGHERSVLEGALKTIDQDQPVLLIECAHPAHTCLEVLRQHGYRVIDAEHLSLDCAEDSCNFFCIPQRYAGSIESLLRDAGYVAA